MGWYKNARNGDVVEVDGESAKRLDGLENWSKVSKPSTAEPAPVPAPGGPGDAALGQGKGTDADTPVGDVKANDVAAAAVKRSPSK